MQKRKPRSDRNHLVYMISSKNGDTYIGITVCLGRAIQKSLKKRFNAHIKRALEENLNWPICVAIREQGFKNFSISLIEIVRGKKLAHVREFEIIQQKRPNLNLLGIKNAA